MTTPFARNSAALSQRAGTLSGAPLVRNTTTPGPVPSRSSMYDILPQYHGGYQPPPSQDNGVTLGGIGSGIIDILTRGVGASAGLSKALVQNIQHDKNAVDPLYAAWQGLKGDTHNTYSDVISQINPDAPEWVKFTGGLAGDILLDPANLVAGGVLSAAKVGVKALQAGKIAEKTALEATNAAAPALTAAARKALPQVSLKTRSDTVIPFLSVNRQAGLTSNAKIAKLADPLRRRFTPGYGFEVMNDALRTGSQTSETLVSDFRKNLNKINKDHSESSINDAYSAYSRGVIPNDPAVKAAMDAQLPGIMRYSDAQDPFINKMVSSKAGIGILNKSMKSKGISFQLDPLKATVMPRGVGATRTGMTINPDLVLKQMKDWEPKDVLRHQDQMHQAVMQAKVYQNFADSVVKLTGKTSARPGMVRLKDLEGTELGPHLKQAMGDTVHYFPKDIAEQLTRVNHFMSQPTSFKDSTSLAAKTIKNVVVPVMNIWKPYMTIARPGHHVRNVYSDVMISAMDGVNNAGVYHKALKTLKTGGALRKTGVPGLNELEANVGRGTDKLSTVRLNGSNLDVSTDKMYKSAYNEGLLPSHHVSEDFITPSTTASTGAGKGGITKALLENPYMRGAGWVSEQTNHFTRLAHFIGLMEKKGFTRQFSTLDEAAHAAAVRVKKYHPDPSGLTPFEQKNMRLAFPFYSWTRQTMPAVLNAAISKPGKVTGLSKAAYEFSKAMGINPNSIADPFPDNGVYPSFIHQNLLGPLANTGWGQIGLTTGSPQESIFGDVLNNPSGAALSNLNPLAKAITEGAFGVNVDTGKPIINKTDRIDQQIPIINQIAKLTGYSPSSIPANIIGRQGVLPSQTANAKKGTNNIPLNLINLLTGAGASDFQKSTYRNIARQEATGQ